MSNISGSSGYLQKANDFLLSNLNVNNFNLNNVLDPILAQDAATKHYVDSSIGGGGYWTEVGSNIVNSNTGTVAIANLTTSGVVHNSASGVLSSSQVVLSDISSSAYTTTGAANKLLSLDSSGNATANTYFSLNIECNNSASVLAGQIGIFRSSDSTNFITIGQYGTVSNAGQFAYSSGNVKISTLNATGGVYIQNSSGSGIFVDASGNLNISNLTVAGVLTNNSSGKITSTPAVFSTNYASTLTVKVVVFGGNVTSIGSSGSSSNMTYSSYNATTGTIVGSLTTPYTNLLYYTASNSQNTVPNILLLCNIYTITTSTVTMQVFSSPTTVQNLDSLANGTYYFNIFVFGN